MKSEKWLKGFGLKFDDFEKEADEVVFEYFLFFYSLF